MKSLIENLNSATEQLDRASKRLDELKHARKLLDFRGHQEEAKIRIAGVLVEINYMDSGYAQRVKKGYEMIQLGAQKVYNGMIDDQASEIESIKLKITQIAHEIAGTN